VFTALSIVACHEGDESSSYPHALEVFLFSFHLFLGGGGGVEYNRVHYTEAITGLLYQPWMIDDDDCVEQSV
jgi:hypothetical protein